MNNETECSDYGSNLLLTQLLVPIDLVLLFLVLLDFAGDTAPLRKVESGIFGSMFLCLLCFLVFWGQFEGAADLLNQPRELFRGL